MERFAEPESQRPQGQSRFPQRRECQSRLGQDYEGFKLISPNRTRPNLLIFAICLSTLILFRSPLEALASLAVHDDRYFQGVAGPALCLFLMYWERARIFANSRFSPRLGVPLFLAAMLLGLVILRHPVSGPASIDEASSLFPSSLSPVISAVALVWMAAFFLCYGARSFSAALFPFCCLLLMIPVPLALMDRVALALQHASADASYALLRSADVPVFRQGMKFSLAGLDIEVAPECSGIRSCLALMIAGILASRVCLRSGWRRWVLILMTIPIAIVKNAVRIVVLATLGAYVDRAVLSGPLHHYGGLVFAFVGLALFVPLLSALQKAENRAAGLSAKSPSVAAIQSA